MPFGRRIERDEQHGREDEVRRARDGGVTPAMPFTSQRRKLS